MQHQFSDDYDMGRAASARATTSLAPAIAVAVLALCLSGLAGCYEHVVRAEGPGAESYDIYEPTDVMFEPAPDTGIRSNPGTGTRR